MNLGWRTAFAISTAIAGAGRRAGALTGRATLAATGVGASILRGGGVPGGALLATFFVSGSALPRLFSTTRRFKSDAARNERQVIANGGAAACAALAAPLIGRERALVGIAGSLAAATADTWATEIGSTSRRPPRMILSGRPVEPGLSGGVTARGNAGALAGAALIAALAGALARDGRITLPVAAAGVGGALLDSMLGELVQAKYQSREHGAIVEDLDELPTPAARLVSGIRFVDNDVVNLACTISGGLVSLLLYDAVCRISRHSNSR